MAYLFAIPVVLFLIVLVVGGLTGRVRTSPCCSTADPSRDLRIRASFETPEQLEPANDLRARPPASQVGHAADDDAL